MEFLLFFEVLYSYQRTICLVELGNAAYNLKVIDTCTLSIDRHAVSCFVGYIQHSTFEPNSMSELALENNT